MIAASPPIAAPPQQELFSAAELWPLAKLKSLVWCARTHAWPTKRGL